MLLLNETPFIGVPLAGRLNFPGHSLTLIVKGTFDLVAGGRAVAAEEQLYPGGDEHYPDDGEHASNDGEQQGSLRYPSDFAYFKPRADLLLAGTCHAPGGRPVAQCPVVFQVGERRGTLSVSGDRTWQRTQAEPFTCMPLRYERSFGGAADARNPVGRGLDAVAGPDGRPVVPLPNIEHPNALLRSSDQRPEPAGFAPLNQTWALRHAKLGTYDGGYIEQRWPWFAEDFDWGFFNAAPPEMQLEGYLRGDEPLYFENLHPEHPQFRSALPGLRLRCFVDRRDSTAEPASFREVPMRLDTLWVDMDAPKLVLVWRGPAKVETEEYAEIDHVLVVAERLDEPPETVEHYRALLERRLAELQQEGDILVEEPAAADEDAPAPADAAAAELEIERAETEARARLLAAGIDPDNLPPPDEEALRKEAQILQALGFEAREPETVPASREALEASAAAGESLAGRDFSGLDLTGVALEDIDLHDANLTDAVLRDAKLARSSFREADMAGADLRGADLGDADLTGADLTGSRLAGANLSGAALAGATFEGADMAGAILTKAEAQGALFVGANLNEASGRGANFDGADFSAATLVGADLRACTLREASFDGAVGHRIDLSGADITELRAAGCDLSHGLFMQARGADSSWAEAVLSGADFRYAYLEGVDFTAASMNGVDLFAANMKAGRLAKARLSDARLVQANLFQASLEKADLTGANLSGSNLYGAETLDARLVSTRLDGANVKMTKLARPA